MKQLIMAILLSLLVAPSALAHTQLSSTSPAHGEVVTTPLTEISLTYAGQIEEGSHFELTNSTGEKIEIISLTVFDGVMTGTVAEPLANDDYTVKWDSISEDGHPLNGTFSFTVNVPESEQPVATENESSDAVENETVNATEEAEAMTDSVEEPAEDSSNTPILIVVGILVVIIVASLVVLFTRRKG